MDRGSGQELRKIDVTVAVMLLAVAVALRIPFRSQMAYYWDSAQFALAVGEYNLRSGQPHVPGFYLYVMLGRLVNLFVGEPHAALVWLSVFAGAWLVSAGYLLATSMFGRRCGWGTGLILMTSPLCWFHSDIALTTIVDSALVVTFVFVCWQAIQQRVTWFQTVLLAALLAAVAGVRQQSALLLLPLYGYVFWGFARPRSLKLSCAIALAGGFSLVWLVPTLKSAGGLPSYVELLHLKSKYDAPRIFWAGGGWIALLTNIYNIGRAFWVGLWAAAIISVMEFLHGACYKKRVATSENRRQFSVLALWITPIFLFDLFIYVALPGHILNFFPAVVIMASLGLVRFSEQLPTTKARGAAVVFAAVVAVNLVVFLHTPPTARRLSMGLNMSGEEIREHDADLLGCFKAIRQGWPAKDVVVYHYYEDFYWGFRHFEYHLPEYRNVLLVSDASLLPPLGTMKWVGRDRQTTFVRDIPAFNDTDIIVVVPPGESLDIFRHVFDVRGSVLVMDGRVKLYVLRRWNAHASP
jgi:hypothetical protein